MSSLSLLHLQLKRYTGLAPHPFYQQTQMNMTTENSPCPHMDFILEKNVEAIYFSAASQLKLPLLGLSGLLSLITSASPPQALPHPRCPLLSVGRAAAHSLLRL